MLKEKFKYKLKLLITASAVVATQFMVGCSLGGSSPSSVSPFTNDKIKLSSQTLISYNANSARLKLIGFIDLTEITDLTQIEFYGDANCLSGVVGSGIHSDFKSTGISIEIGSGTPSSVYLKTNTIDKCFFVMEFQPQYSAPALPQNFQTQPLSPSRETATPLIMATPSLFMSKIDFYDDVQCSHGVGSGLAEVLKLSGVLLNLQPNTTSSIYAIAEESFGHRSACELVYQYKHSTRGPSAPSFTSISPLSPSKSSTTPLLKGGVDNTVVSVKIFKDPNCATSIAEDTATAFIGEGITLHVDANTINDLYVIGYDVDQNPSPCTFLTRYIHDTVSPLATPQFDSAAPASPTRLTTYPKIKGLVGGSDVALVKFYNGVSCTKLIGSGTKSEFESAGISVGVDSNSTTFIYATNVDLAGNESSCVYLTNYRHNTIPPDPPVFNTTIPLSPTNKTSDPVILGSAGSTAVTINIYKDEACTQMIGTGAAQDFLNTGLVINATPNATTTVYATALDLEGNVSSCSSLTNFAHSTVAAPPPIFSYTIPTSPSRITSTPYVVGTGSVTLSSVFLFSDSSCSNSIGSGSRSTFVTMGILVSVPKNAQSSIYAISMDVYGNSSPCTLLSQYIHDDRPPLNPGFVSVSPASPNNVSATPLIVGSLTADPLKVLPVTQVGIFDSSLCINRVGVGTPVEFTGIGINSILAPNTINYVYVQAFDDAGNSSACTSLLTYMHSTIPPGKPQFVSITPNTPSFVSEVKLKGTLGPSTDFLAVAAVDIYKDSLCTQTLTSATLSDFTGASGVDLSLPKNSITPIYAQSRDVVGNKSTCQLMINFRHSDVAPTGFTANPKPDGSIDLSWLPDMVASPTAVYRIKRSLTSGGPYTLIQSSVNGNSFNDGVVSANTTYYYLVSAANNTGHSLDSIEISAMSSPVGSITPTSLILTPESGQIVLSWTGFGANVKYRVYRSLQSGGPYQALAKDTVSTSFVDTTVTNGVVYYYVVTGINNSGESFQSDEASAVPLDIPPAPTQLTYVLESSSTACSGGRGVHLSWNPSAYHNGYAVFRGNASNNETFYAATAGTEYVDCNPLTNSGDYNYNRNYYKVAAKWGANYSDLSNEVIMTNITGVNAAIDAGLNHNFIYWSGLTGATSYVVERADHYAGPFTIYQTGLTTTQLLDSALTNDHTYYYRISGDYGGGGQLGWPSAIVNGTPHAAPSAASQLTLFVNNKKPVLNWIAPTHFDGFNIYRAANVGGPYSFLTRVPTPTYTDTSSLNSMNYYYVKTVWGTSETTATNIVSFRGGTVSGVTAVAGASSITVSWNFLSGISSYSVYRSTTSGGPYSLVYTGAALSFIDSTVASSTGYYYVVAGNFSDATQTQYSSEVSGMLTGSNIPSGLTVITTTGSSVQLAWAKVNSATSYKVYKGTSLTGPFTTPQSTTNTTLSYAGLNGQTKYYFVVTATVSGAESGHSSAISATTYIAPAAPTLIPGNNTMDLQWGSVMGVTSYTLERSTDGVNFSTIASGIPLVSYSDAGVTNGTLYFYRIIAVFPGGINLVSPISMGSSPGITPLVPQGLSLDQNISGNDVTISWNTVSGATTYKVYLSTVSGGPWGSAVLTTASSLGNIITGLTAGTEYFIAVSALRGKMESALSSELAFVAEATPPAPTVAVVATNTVQLSWSAVAGATTYEVQRSSNRVDFSTIATGVVGVTYDDTTVVSGVSYVYRYLPRKANASPLAISNVSVDIEYSALPLTPMGLRAQISSGGTAIDLNWTSTSGASSYNLYRSTALGGPYSLVQNIIAPNNLYHDATALLGNEYFYYLRSVNAVSVESISTPAIAINFVASPTGLNANVVNSTISISWDSVIGATGYHLRRSKVSGGPYGIIANNIKTTSFIDTDIENGVTYYYVVQSLAASGAESMLSSEVSQTGSVQMNLELPVELIDAPLSSKTSNQTFERSRTSLDTNDYDGTVTYTLEVHTRNQDGAPQTIQLLDNSDVIVASIVVPANTSLIKRMTTGFVPTPNFNNYRLLLPGTTSAGLLEVLSARIIVKQVNGTKTKIYYPLTNTVSDSNSEDLLGPIGSTSLTNFVSLDYGSLWIKRSQNLSLIKEDNGWELETLVAATNGAEGSVVLYNRSKDLYISNTQGLISSSGTISLVRSPFSEGADGFTTANNGDSYELRLRCDALCTAGQVSVYKSGLWVTLRSLKQVEIYYRASRAFMGSINSSISDTERVFIDLTSFSNPQALFQVTGFSPSGDTIPFALLDIFNLDTDTSPSSSVSGSVLNINSNVKMQARTSAPLTLTTGHRFVVESQSSPGSYIFLDGGVVIQAHP